MVSVCLPSDALLQHLPSYLGFSYLGHGVSLHGCSSKVQSLLLTLDEGYLLTAALPDLQRGIAPLGPPAPAQPPLLGCGVRPPGCCPWLQVWGSSSRPPPVASGMGAWGSSFRPPPLTSDLGRMWSTGEGNGKPLQYSCLENPMNSINIYITLLITVYAVYLPVKSIVYG